MKSLKLLIIATLASFTAACQSPGSANSNNRNEQENGTDTQASSSDSAQTYGRNVQLPEPYKTRSVRNEGKAIGWEKGKMPLAPEGFTVSLFAGDLKHPRWLYIGPNGDVFVAESDDGRKSADRITLLRDVNKDGKPDVKKNFLNDLNQPFGMLILDGYFYVANTNALVRYPYEPGQTEISAQGEKILDLPAGGYNHHWTRNLLANEDGSKIYISVGSASDVGEYGMNEEKRRANILEINPDGSGERIYAYGLRNPVGMDWNPADGSLWTAVNERDKLGDNSVPDYLTGVKEGAFYGWPYAYWGNHVEPRRKGEAPEMVEKSVKPDMALGAHTASLGLAFYDKEAFPGKYRNGAFIAQHGSWNRSTLNGYTVLFLPFENGRPTGKAEKFLTNFIVNLGEAKVYGRPVGVFVTPGGDLLVTDDDGNAIWKVSYNQP